MSPLSRVIQQNAKCLWGSQTRSMRQIAKNIRHASPAPEVRWTLALLSRQKNGVLEFCALWGKECPTMTQKLAGVRVRAQDARRVRLVCGHVNFLEDLPDVLHANFCGIFSNEHVNVLLLNDEHTKAPVMRQLQGIKKRGAS